MKLKELIKKEHISIYALAKKSNISYSTLSDMVNGKTLLHKCSCDKVFRLAKALNVTMESLIESSIRDEIMSLHKELSEYDVFRGNIAYMIKSQGDLNFIADVLKNKRIDSYYKHQNFTKALYLLATVDYLSRENNIPLCTAYDNLRKIKFPSPVIPLSLQILSSLPSGKNSLEEARQNAIPEFLRHNIIEGNIRDVA